MNTPAPIKAIALHNAELAKCRINVYWYRKTYVIMPHGYPVQHQYELELLGYAMNGMYHENVTTAPDSTSN